ncbi:uncharacterized protein [Miscanthus floridulus]|uniref:uncharacterized protein n=1 Tax=Miscanthus floridulus TaxID=154761 RepID=UPI0034578356
MTIVPLCTPSRCCPPPSPRSPTSPPPRASSPSPAPSPVSDCSSTADALVSRPRLGSADSRATALEELACSVAALPASSTAAAVSAVAMLLESTGGGEDLLPAVAALAAFASSDAARPSLTQEVSAMVPHLCRTLESGGTAAEHACVALLPLRVTSRDASATVAVSGGVAALLAACAGDTPATQAAAARMLRNLAAFLDLLPAFHDGGALPLLLQLVSPGTPRAG